ncbi:hypothetical protein [Paraburkholderia solisilvae]
MLFLLIAPEARSLQKTPALRPARITARSGRAVAHGLCTIPVY